MATRTGKRAAEYQLYYWPSIQGRGEFIRLAFEAAEVPFLDVARASGRGRGMAALESVLAGKTAGLLPFAPPILRHGDLTIAQTANILAYLGPRLGLVPRDEASRLAAHQHQLTIADLVVEAHDVHHPIGVDLYYEQQKREARRRAEVFIASRMPKFLGYFEKVLARNQAATAGARWHALGRTLTYVDLSLFQVMAGLAYAFPNALSALERKLPRLCALRDGVAAVPPVAWYLASPRRIPFNEYGIFRHYPELDAAPRSRRGRGRSEARAS
jgi:glutathione S-transferase